MTRPIGSAAIPTLITETLACGSHARFALIRADGTCTPFLRFPNSGTFLCQALTLHHDGGFMSAAACIFRAVWAPRARSARSRRCKYQVLPAARVSGGCGHGAWPCVGPRRRAEGARPL